MTRHRPRADMLRQAVAREAARLMIEHGHEDYGVAKRKAAERFGVTDLAVLPKNTEIEEALAEHQRLFVPDAHANQLSAMRSTALEAMRLFADFEPRLVGPLLTGTATAHNDITLHLFADTPESVAVRLIDRSIPHEFAERRFRVQRDEVCASMRADTASMRPFSRATAFARHRLDRSTDVPCDARLPKKSRTCSPRNRKGTHPFA